MSQYESKRGNISNECMAVFNTVKLLQQMVTAHKMKMNTIRDIKYFLTNNIDGYLQDPV